MKKDYKIRVITVFLLFFFLFIVVIIRLFLLQVKQKTFFKELAQQQYEIVVTCNAPRAPIYDRSGNIALAFNREVLSAFILPHELNHQQEMELFLQQYYPDVYKRLLKHPERHFWWLERKLDPVRLAKLKEHNLDDIHFINESQRFYPVQSAAHVVGFTDMDNSGIGGIELLYNKRLMGLPALIKLEKDARAKNLYFEKLIKKPGEPGNSVRLTIDSTLQFLANEELKRAVDSFEAKGGSVIIMNPDNGQILTMTNCPLFDPNQRTVTNLEVTKNSAVTECYELGSVMKAFCALAALEESVVQYDELVDCGGKVAYIDGVRVENWTRTEVVPFYDVIKFSSNVGIAKIGKRLGPKYYEHLRKLGFGTKTEIEFPGERVGFVNAPEKWSRSSLIVMSFGYEIMASLLQLCRAFCLIANGGYLITPTLVLEPASAQSTQRSSRLYKPQTIRTMKNILEKVGARYVVSGYRIMGKTGTARFARDGKYSAKDHVYTFAGIVERNNYRRVIVTFIKEPKKTSLWASEIAAPLFQKIAERMVIYESTR